MYARLTGLANKQPSFDLWLRAHYNNVMCMRSITKHTVISFFATLVGAFSKRSLMILVPAWAPPLLLEQCAFSNGLTQHQTGPVARDERDLNRSLEKALLGSVSKLTFVKATLISFRLFFVSNMQMCSMTKHSQLLP